MKKFIFITLCISSFVFANDTKEGFVLNFPQVPIKELIHFVSKVSQVNFIYNEEDLNFKTSVVSGRSVSEEELLQILVKILKNNNFSVKKEGGYYLLERKGSQAFDEGSLLAGDPAYISSSYDDKDYFSTYKLQYQLGSVILGALKNLHLSHHRLKKAVDSIQWLESTNTLVYTCDEELSGDIENIIRKLDQPKKQVFIEILVIETDVHSGLDFGLEWSAISKYKDRFVTSINNSPSHGNRGLGSSIQHAAKLTDVTGASIPSGVGFDLGIIGDLILHKGKTFITLGSLITALQSDNHSSIVLNQKIITQDNEESTIFVGDNLPFTGSVVETVGSSQQTTANIEYRDVGVNLRITPLLGDDGIISLKITEEISEAVSHPMQSSGSVNGIQTTKTNMVTKVHVPDQHFLILSGMIRDAKSNYKSGVPCLGGLPVVGAAFSKNNTKKEKRNIIIFVKPQIVNQLRDYDSITQNQMNDFKIEAADKKHFQKGLNLVK